VSDGCCLESGQPTLLFVIAKFQLLQICGFKYSVHMIADIFRRGKYDSDISGKHYMQLKLNASRLQDAAHTLRPTQQVKRLRETAPLLGGGTSYAKTTLYECCMMKSLAISDHGYIFHI